MEKGKKKGGASVKKNIGKKERKRRKTIRKLLGLRKTTCPYFHLPGGDCEKSAPRKCGIVYGKTGDGYREAKSRKKKKRYVEKKTLAPVPCSRASPATT